MELKPINDYIQIKPVKSGVISSSDGNEYEVVKCAFKYIDSAEDLKNGTPDFKGVTEFKEYEPGDIVIVEDHMIIRTNISGEETLYVKEDTIIARTYGFTKYDQSCEGLGC